MNVFKSTLPVLVVLAGSVLASLPAQAAPQACASVTQVERRIVERAKGDVDSLRQYVGMTAIVYGVNMFDVRDHLDAWRAAVACHEQLAAAQAAAPVAATEPAAAADVPAATPATVVSQR